MKKLICDKCGASIGTDCGVPMGSSIEMEKWGETTNGATRKKMGIYDLCWICTDKLEVFLNERKK
jgi:hypothetical protein